MIKVDTNRFASDKLGPSTGHISEEHKGVLKYLRLQIEKAGSQEKEGLLKIFRLYASYARQELGNAQSITRQYRDELKDIAERFLTDKNPEIAKIHNMLNNVRILDSRTTTAEAA